MKTSTISDTQVLPCSHCGILTQVTDSGTNPIFCCIGCKTVYNLLKTNGLENFYTLKEEWTMRPLTSGVKIASEKFDYLDNSEFKKEYVRFDEKQELATLNFYLEGIHCLGCLWLIEKLPELCENVVKVRLDIAKSCAEVTIKENGKFSLVADRLNQFGYTPHPIKDEAAHQLLLKQEMRKNLIRIGIAGAGTGNIMLLSICIYAGLTGPLANYFNLIAFLLALPVITYSAFPFYLNSWVALKNRTINLDLPIVIAIISGIGLSLFNMFKVNGEHYFDSVTAIIFLLLSSRFFLKSIQQVGIGSEHITHFFRAESLRRWNSIKSVFENIHFSLLKREDIIQIGAGEMICADGVVIKGESEVNLSLLTGESYPQKVKPLDKVFSGTMNMGSDIEVKVLAMNLETKIGTIIKKIIEGNHEKTDVENLSDKVGKYYLYTTFLISLGLIFYFFLFENNFSEGFYRAFALVLISCPCVLGFAAPFTFSLSLSKAAKKGIIIKGENTLEKVSQIKNIILDKTGTLTVGEFGVHTFLEIKPNPFTHAFSCYEELIFNLEKKSKHAIAIALMKYIEKTPHLPFKQTSSLENIQEVFGIGMTAQFENSTLELKAVDTSGQNHLAKKIGLFINNELCFEIVLSDEIRPESFSVIKSLQKDFNLFLASGDEKEIVDDVASKLNFNSNNAFANLSPEDKFELIKKHEKVMMVGDGGNDAYALSRSHVGVAVSGSMELSLSVADVYLINPGVASILDLITIGKETIRLIKRNLVISVTYNIIGGVLAILGLVTPLMAAVLMPLSAFSVFLSVLISNKKLRVIWNKK